MHAILSDKDFGHFRNLIARQAGIHLADGKKGLVSGRLGRRLRHYGLQCYGDYYALIDSGEYPEEMQVMVDLLTTNETYFFREPRHFDFLRERLLPSRRSGEWRVWCAAASSGQEPYTLAMLLDDQLGQQPWQLLATDINTEVLSQAQQGIYPIKEAENIPPAYLKRYCLKGTGNQQGRFLVSQALRQRVRFRQLNLNGAWDVKQRQDLIMLRNVMIYFERETKIRLVQRLADQLHPGGHLIVGHSETLNGISDRFRVISPSIYQLK